MWHCAPPGSLPVALWAVYSVLSMNHDNSRNRCLPLKISSAATMLSSPIRSSDITLFGPITSIYSGIPRRFMSGSRSMAARVTLSGLSVPTYRLHTSRSVAIISAPVASCLSADCTFPWPPHAVNRSRVIMPVIVRIREISCFFVKYWLKGLKSAQEQALCTDFLLTLRLKG